MRWYYVCTVTKVNYSRWQHLSEHSVILANLIFGINKTAIVKLWRSWVWMLGKCLFVCCLLACLFAFGSQNSLFCSKKRLYVSSSTIKCLYSYLALFFSQSLDSEIGQVLGYALQCTVLRFHLLSLYKKRQFLPLYLAKDYIARLCESLSLLLLSVSGFWWCLRPRTWRFVSVVVPAKYRQRCEFRFLGKCEFILISAVTACC